MRPNPRPGAAWRSIPLVALALGMLPAPSLAGGAEVLTVGGTGSDLGALRAVARAFEASHRGLRVNVLPSLGSGGAVKAVLSGAIDLAITARPLEAAERAAGAREVLYARTPLTFAVHASAPVDAVSTATLVDIHAGHQTRWPQGGIVRPVLRPRTDTDAVVLARSLPELGEALETAYRRRGVPVAMTDQDAADLIEKAPGGLGVLSLSVILGEDRPLKALALDGVAPSPGTLADGSYPLGKPLYCVFGPAPRVEVLELVALLRGETGAAILAATGHLVVAPDTPAP